jgi:hypothetical protein
LDGCTLNAGWILIVSSGRWWSLLSELIVLGEDAVDVGLNGNPIGVWIILGFISDRAIRVFRLARQI